VKADANDHYERWHTPSALDALSRLHSWLDEHAPPPTAPWANSTASARGYILGEIVDCDIKYAAELARSRHLSHDARLDAEARAMESQRTAAASAARRLANFFRQHGYGPDVVDVCAAHLQGPQSSAVSLLPFLEALETAIEARTSRRESRIETRKETGHWHTYHGCVRFAADRTGAPSWSLESVLLFALLYRIRSYLQWCRSGAMPQQLAGPMPPADDHITTPWTLLVDLVHVALPPSNESKRLDGPRAEKRMAPLLRNNPDAELFVWPPSALF